MLKKQTVSSWPQLCGWLEWVLMKCIERRCNQRMIACVQLHNKLKPSKGISMPRFSRRSVLQTFLSSSFAASTARAERKQIASEYFEIVRKEVFLPGLNALHDGIRVAQLSDIHIGQDVPLGRVISAVRVLNQEAPDIALLTGDFVTTRRDNPARVPQLLGQIKAPSFAVLGNHDYWSGHHEEIIKGLEGQGISLLRNQHSNIRINGADFSIVGIDDSTTQNDDVAKTFSNLQNTSRIIATHTPSLARKLPAWQGDLCIAGHTHGGQWNFGQVTKGVFRTAGQPWFRGDYGVRGNHLYVNRGLGFGVGTRLPRVNSPPELTIFTLRAGTLSTSLPKT
jgi:uncharacterized protein